MLGLPAVAFSPIEFPDPFFSAFARLPFSPAVHTFLGSGLAHPRVCVRPVCAYSCCACSCCRRTVVCQGLNALPSIPSVQTLGQRAANALLSPLIERMALPLMDASQRRIVREFNLSAPLQGFSYARLLLVNAAPGVATPRSLPPFVKASGC